MGDYHDMMRGLADRRRAEKAVIDARVYAAVCRFDQEATIYELSEALRLRHTRLAAPLRRLEKRGLVRSWRALTSNKRGTGPRYYRKVEVEKTGT